MSRAKSVCPTCPDGKCPSINTMPDCPKPAAKRIAEAERAIPDVLAELFQVDSRHETTASRLVESLHLVEYGGHLTPAVKWAIHNLIETGMLSAHAGYEPFRHEPISKRVFNPAGYFTFEHSPSPGPLWYTYGEEPADFSKFLVRAEEPLWRSWAGQDNKSQESESSLASVASLGGSQNDVKVTIGQCKGKLNQQDNGDQSPAVSDSRDFRDAERDQWLYEQWQHEEKTWATILCEFEQVRADKRWTKLTSTNGIRNRVESYAEAKELPLRKGTGGRPKKLK